MRYLQGVEFGWSYFSYEEWLLFVNSNFKLLVNKCSLHSGRVHVDTLTFHLGYTPVFCTVFTMNVILPDGASENIVHTGKIGYVMDLVMSECVSILFWLWADVFLFAPDFTHEKQQKQKDAHVCAGYSSSSFWKRSISYYSYCDRWPRNQPHYF